MSTQSTVYIEANPPPIFLPCTYPLPLTPYLRFGRLGRLGKKSAMSWCGCKLVSVDIANRPKSTLVDAKNQD